MVLFQLIKKITLSTCKHCLAIFGECEPDVLWLKINNAPWNEVCSRWELTTLCRANANGRKSLSEIYEEWPILKFPEALQLVYLHINKYFSDCNLFFI